MGKGRLYWKGTNRGKKRWKIRVFYKRDGSREKLQKLGEFLEEEEKGCVLLGGEGCILMQESGNLEK